MRPAGTADFLIIGGGVIGLTIALELKRRHPEAAVTLIEKENDCGVHASGRNSGVLHAGFYYTADTLKARFTKAGNRAWTAYCEARGLRINRCGKLVVARNAGELPVMDELVRRARANGIELQELTAEEARLIEPRVRTYERALFSPTTSSVDPAEVVAAVVADARALGITICTSTAYRGAEAGGVRTSAGRVAAGYVINAAGLYADRIARDYGFGERYRILPFKGLYLYGNGGSRPPQTHVYPVPDLRQPFLGVHFTRPRFPPSGGSTTAGWLTSTWASARRFSPARRGCSSPTPAISDRSRGARSANTAGGGSSSSPPSSCKVPGPRNTAGGAKRGSAPSCSTSRPGRLTWIFAA